MDPAEFDRGYSPWRLWLLPLAALALLGLGVAMQSQDSDGSFVALSGAVPASFCPVGPKETGDHGAQSATDELLLWTRARLFGAQSALVLTLLSLVLLALTGEIAGWMPTATADWGILMIALVTVQAAAPALRVAAAASWKGLRGRMAARAQGRTV